MTELKYEVAFLGLMILSGIQSVQFSLAKTQRQRTNAEIFVVLLFACAVLNGVLWLVNS